MSLLVAVLVLNELDKYGSRKRDEVLFKAVKIELCLFSLLKVGK